MKVVLTQSQVSELGRLRDKGKLHNSGSRLRVWTLTKITLWFEMIDLTRNGERSCRLVDRVGGAVSLSLDTCLRDIFTDEQKKKWLREYL